MWNVFKKCEREMQKINAKVYENKIQTINFDDYTNENKF